MAEQNTFKELIIERGFHRYQSGLRSRFRSWNLNYELIYGEITSKPSLSMTFTNDFAIGQVTLWVSGECDMEVIDCTTGNDLLRDSYLFGSSDEFFTTYPEVPLLINRLSQSD